ncbi:MAG TPA: xanthine dehydrogenase family protein subunit M [Gemmatimonadaceae bacterium]|nr:xanthine dehydrogenase family protein subunit M [Gemmatimonadaceae bacterium]
MSLSHFEYHRPESVAEAARLLESSDALPMGGGTDLLVLIKEQLAHPESVVDLRAIPASRSVAPTEDGGLRIGASARIADLARDEGVRSRFPALASACESVGTTALRHMGTIGGNLCQRPRCWYLRRNIPCLKNGGSDCPAATGENQYHAILGGGPCYIVHPSDPAVALTALDAMVEVSSARGSRRLPIVELYVLPAERLDRETVLADDEIITAVEIPGASAGGTQSYEKLMQRGSWDFALTSLASVRTSHGDVRLVLGGVAPKPWRLSRSIEEEVAKGGLEADDVARLVDGALYEARPLAHNGYKVQLARTLLRRAIIQLSAAARPAP